MIDNNFLIIWSIGMITMFFFSLFGGKNFKSEIMSVGILGTFVGIYLGLYKFDVNHLEKSVPLLLEGMKFAFLTSIEGMGLAILLSIIIKKEKNKVDSLLEELIKINKEQIELLQNFAGGNSEEFVKALNEVIKKLNSDIIKEMGFNFEKLNNSINTLIEWQEKNKDLIENTAILLKQGDEILVKYKEAEDILKNINNETRKSVDIVKESLSLLLKEINGRI